MPLGHHVEFEAPAVEKLEEVLASPLALAIFRMARHWEGPQQGSFFLPQVLVPMITSEQKKAFSAHDLGMFTTRVVVNGVNHQLFMVKPLNLWWFTNLDLPY